MFKVFQVGIQDNRNSTRNPIPEIPDFKPPEKGTENLKTWKFENLKPENRYTFTINVHVLDAVSQASSTNQKINQSINQSTNQPTDQQINQSINRPTNRPTNQSTIQSV
jgi:hypothetical protein